MESPTKATVNDIPKEGGGNERSTIEFPYADLDSSIEIVRGVHAVGGTTCEYEQLAAHLSLEPKGGGFRTRVTGAKTFALLTYERGGRITLTELGRQIIDAQQERAAREDAFLKVPLFAKVYENFKGRPLPPQAGLERALIGYGVGSKVVKNARQVLMRSAKQAGYFELSQDRLTAPPNVNRSATSEPPPRKEGYRNGSGGDGSGGGYHPLIEGLLVTLPQAQSSWSTVDRMNWLVMANSIFKTLYPPQDEGEIQIVLKETKQN